MGESVQVVVPAGTFGPSEHDNLLDKMLREIAVAICGDKSGPSLMGSPQRDAAKYGKAFENEVFMMHHFCWCDAEDGSCLWCIHGDHLDFDKLLGAHFGNEDKTEPYQYARHKIRHYWDPPNFWYKPTDFRLTWYKYICRDTATNREVSAAEVIAMYDLCTVSIREG